MYVKCNRFLRVQHKTYCLAVSVAAGSLKTIYSPILMTFLLLKVSGVALLEKGLAKTKPQYKEYIESTPAFVPSLSGIVKALLA